MRVAPRTRLRTIRNVLARIPGREDQVVVIGNHYDAWVRGGVDPHSGTATLLEIARGLSALREEGWRPRRDLLLAFWDAEEFGAVGSTEFVEARRESLGRRAVAYLNVDVLTAGTLDVSGSPSLRDLVWSAAGEVGDPLADRSLAEGWASRSPGGEGPPALGALGVGSDWTAFFHHAGVPSLQWTMNGRGSYHVYHSALDDPGYLRTHADSALLHVPRMAGVMGITALRLAQAEALPLDYVRYADRIAGLVDSVAGTGPEGPAPGEDELRRLRAAVAEFRAASRDLDAARRRGVSGNGDGVDLRRINRALPRVEGDFLRAPGRGWYRHLIYTSDPRTGYGAVPVPSLRPERRREAPDHADGSTTAGSAAPAGSGASVGSSGDPPTIEELVEALRAATRRLRGVLPADPGG
jgi:N-acetylated-alpha-linked acidic dipeptidase